MQQKKVFTGGINSDFANEILPDGVDRYRLNVRVLDPSNGQVACIEPVQGNTAITVSLPSGTNTVIGSKEYTKIGKVYFFVHNSNNYHTIWEYDLAGTLSKVFYDLTVDLNFDLNHLITGIDFIELDANNHLMYWTDNYNEPRKINIEKGKFFSAGDYVNGYKSPFDLKWINRIKIPPTVPSSAWDNDTTKEVNYLVNKLFTFKVRFVYDDYEVSACSPISTYTYPDVTRSGSSEPTTTQDNYIKITIPTGSSIVKRVQILAKEVNDLDYSQIVDIDKAIYGLSNDSTFTYNWYNDNVTIPVEVNESIKLFDNIPLKSQSQAIITNRICDGLITEGFDPVDIDMKIDIDTTPVSVDNTGVLAQRSYLKTGGIYTYGIVYYDYANRSGVSNITPGNTTDYQDSGAYGTTLHYTPIKYGLSGAPLPGQYLPVNWEIYNNPPSWATHYQIVRSKNNACEMFWQFACGVVRYVDSEGYDTTPAAASDLYLYIDNTYGRFREEYGVSGIPFEPVSGDRVRILAKPDYTTASSYPITPSSFIGDYTPYSLSTYIGPYPYNDTQIISFNPANGIIHIKMTSDISQTLYPGALIEVYRPAINNSDTGQILYEIGESYDISTDIYGNRIHNGRSQNQEIISGTAGAWTGGLTLHIEVPTGSVTLGKNMKVVGSGWSKYGVVSAITPNTPSPSLDTIDLSSTFYEGVVASGACSLILPAAGEFMSGDCYHPFLNMPWEMTVKGTIQSSTPLVGLPSPLFVYRIYSYIEAMNVSYFFPSKANDFGRPNKIDPDFRQITRPSTIRYSQKFIPETNINGLSSVFDTNFETYDDQYGGIYKLYAEDQKLIVFQELKVGQILVNQVIYNDMQLQNTVGASDVVLNPQMVYYSGEYGIYRNPESFAVYGKQKYFLDMKRGVVLRLSIDGLTPISDVANYKKYFNKACADRMNKGVIAQAFGFWDTRHNEYVISFPIFEYIVPDTLPIVTVPADTIAFNEKANQWVTHYSFIPENACTAGVDFITFKSGVPYLHDNTANYANFYGTQYYPEVWSVLNANPSNVKVFEAMSLESDPWEITSITNDAGQSSSLVTDDFQLIENMQYAPLWRDSNTPNCPAGTSLFEGDVMRHQTFLVKMKWPNSTYNKLFAVNFNYIISNLHNR